jgi:GAF domain-containing protein
MKASSKGIHPETTGALELIAEGKIKAALERINQQGPHRYTAIFAFESAGLRMACLFDRQNPQAIPAKDLMPLEESYCSFIWKSRHKFILLDASSDERVSGHAKQPVFRSYVGLPILNADGSLWGTICYFDTEPQAVSEEQLELLEQAADQLKTSLVSELSDLRDV